MYLEYSKPRGVPALSVFDADATVLADSGDEGQNIGFPDQPDEIDHYFTILAATCLSLTDSEVAVLRQKLNEVRPNKE